MTVHLHKAQFTEAIEITNQTGLIGNHRRFVLDSRERSFICIQLAKIILSLLAIYIPERVSICFAFILMG